MSKKSKIKKIGTITCNFGVSEHDGIEIPDSVQFDGRNILDVKSGSNWVEITARIPYGRTDDLVLTVKFVENYPVIRDAVLVSAYS